MSITRAFTLRSKRTDAIMSTKLPLRAGSVRSSDKPVDIRTISGPVALLSTTNVLSYNAPDVSTIRAQRKASNSVSSASSRSSAEDSDCSAASHLSRDTTLTDISEPSTPQSATSALFHSGSKRSVRRSVSSSELHRKPSLSSAGSSPEIPSRAPSHSKQAHERVARKRSMQHISNHSSMRSISEDPVSRENRNSFDFFRADLDQIQPQTKAQAPAPAPSHPFGKELEQLDEAVEEFDGAFQAIRSVERDNDFAIMEQHGLGKFCAEDYLREIRPLFSRIFSPPAVDWI